MSQNDDHRQPGDDEDDPLSPQAQAVVDRAGRRAALSMILMLMGFMAIVIVVVYRLATMAPDPGTRYALDTIPLPQGAALVTARLEDGIVTVVYAREGGGGVRLVDGETGTVIRDIPVVPEG